MVLMNTSPYDPDYVPPTQVSDTEGQPQRYRGSDTRGLYTGKEFNWINRRVNLQQTGWFRAGPGSRFDWIPGVDYPYDKQRRQVADYYETNILPGKLEHLARLPSYIEVVTADEDKTVEEVAIEYGRDPEVLAYNLNYRNPDGSFATDQIIPAGVSVPLYGRDLGERILTQHQEDEGSAAYKDILPQGTEIFYTDKDGKEQKLSAQHYDSGRGTFGTAIGGFADSPSFMMASGYHESFDAEKGGDVLGQTEFQTLQEGLFQPREGGGFWFENKILNQDSRNEEAEKQYNISQKRGGGLKEGTVTVDGWGIKVPKDMQVFEFAALTGLNAEYVMGETGLTSGFDFIPEGSVIVAADVGPDGNMIKRNKAATSSVPYTGAQIATGDPRNPASPNYIGTPVRGAINQPTTEQPFQISPEPAPPAPAPYISPLVKVFDRATGQIRMVDQRAVTPQMQVLQEGDQTIGQAQNMYNVQVFDAATGQVRWVDQRAITPDMQVVTGDTSAADAAVPQMTGSVPNQASQDAAVKGEEVINTEDPEVTPTPRLWADGRWFEVEGEDRYIRVYTIPGSENLGPPLNPDGSRVRKDPKFGYRYVYFEASAEDMRTLYPDTDGKPPDVKGVISTAREQRLKSDRIFVEGGSVVEAIISDEYDTFAEFFEEATMDDWDALFQAYGMNPGDVTVNEINELRIAMLDGVVGRGWDINRTIDELIVHTSWWRRRFPHIDRYISGSVRPHQAIAIYTTMEKDLMNRFDMLGESIPSWEDIQVVLGNGWSQDTMDMFFTQWPVLQSNQDAMREFDRLLNAFDPSLAQQVGPLTDTTNGLKFLSGLSPQEAYNFYESQELAQIAGQLGLDQFYGYTDYVQLQEDLQARGIEIDGNLYNRFRPLAQEIVRTGRASDLGQFGLSEDTERDLLYVAAGAPPPSGIDPISFDRTLSRIRNAEASEVDAERPAPAQQIDAQGNVETPTLAKRRETG